MLSCSGGGSPAAGNEDANDINHVLCRSLKALLERDEVFAQAFLGDRRTFERIVKMVAGGHQQQRGSAGMKSRHNYAATKRSTMVLRVQRSAGLHCIVLAFRLTRIDDFAARTCLPVLIAGAMSGVVEYPSEERNKEGDLGNTINNISCTSSTRLSSAQELVSHAIVNPLVEAIEDAAQSLLEALENTHLLNREPSSSSSHRPQPINAGKKDMQPPREAVTTPQVDPPATAGINKIGAPATLSGGRRPTPDSNDKHGERNNRQSGPRKHAPSSFTAETDEENGHSRLLAKYTTNASSPDAGEEATGACGTSHEFDDPSICGTFALRRLCLCGLGFALHPPAVMPEAGSGWRHGVRGRHAKAARAVWGANPRCPHNVGSTPGVTTSLVESLAVLAHCRFLHPDAEAIDLFCSYRVGHDDNKKNDDGDGGQRQEEGASPVQREAPSAAAVGDNKVDDSSLRTSDDNDDDDDDDSRVEQASHSETVVSSNRSVGNGRDGDATTMTTTGRRKGREGGDSRTIAITVRRGVTCMICAGKGPSDDSSCSRDSRALRAMSRLLLSQVNTAELKKAQARSVVLAKRWARKNPTAAATKITVGVAATTMQPATCCRGSRNNSGDNGGEVAPCDGTTAYCSGPHDLQQQQRRRSKCCPSCGLVVLGHPLDTISAWCGEAVVDPNGSAGTPTERNSMGSGWKLTGCIGNKISLDGRAGGGEGRGKAYSYVGATAVALTLGKGGGGRRRGAARSSHQGAEKGSRTSMAMLADAKARAKEAKELKLDRTVDFRRRLAAAANEARQEIQSAALRRRLFQGATAKMFEEGEIEVGKYSNRRNIQNLARNRRSNSSSEGGRLVQGGESNGQDNREGVGGDRLMRVEENDGGNNSEDGGGGDGNRYGGNHGDDVVVVGCSSHGGPRYPSGISRGHNERNKEAVAGHDNDDDEDDIDVGGNSCSNSVSVSNGATCYDDGQHRHGDTITIGDRRRQPSRRRDSEVYRDLARGVDDTHEAILRSMRDDGVDARPYLDERRKAFHEEENQEEDEKRAPPCSGDRGEQESESSSLVRGGGIGRPPREQACTGLDGGGGGGGGGATEWESTAASSAALSVAARDGDQRGRVDSGGIRHGSGGGGRSSTTTSETGGAVGRKNNSATGPAICRDTEQLRLARERRRANAERREMEKREAIEAERGALRRARDREEEARASRKAKALACEEVKRRKEALEEREEATRVEREEEEAARIAAATAEKKRHARLRRAMEREARTQAAAAKLRHEQEMSKIARWREERRNEESARLQAQKETSHHEEAKRSSKLEAISREVERRREETEAMRKEIQRQNEVVAARLKRGEFRYLRGKLVYYETKGALLMAGAAVL